MKKIKQHWGLNLDLKPVDLGYVNLTDAVEVLEERHKNQKDIYETAEQAISETLFGFGEDDEAGCLSITFHGPHPTNVEFSVTRKFDLILFPLPWVTTYEVNLSTFDEIRDLVDAFFNQDQISFAKTMSACGAKKRRNIRIG